MSLPTCCDICDDYNPAWNGDACESQDYCPRYKKYIKDLKAGRISATIEDYNNLSDNVPQEESEED
jgi:hypothetical protein